MTNTKQSHNFMLIWFIFQLVWQLALSYINHAVGGFFSYETLLIMVQIFGNLIPLAAAYFYIRKRTDARGLVAVVPVKPVDLRLVLYAVVMGVAVQPIGMLVSYLSSLFDSSALDAYFGSAAGGSLPMSLFIMAFLPAVTEELICRGVVLKGYLTSGVAPRKAALLNGLFFGLMHMNLRQFFYAFLLGYVIALAVIRSGSVIYGMIMHFVINAVQVILSFALTASTPDSVLSFISFLVFVPLIPAAVLGFGYSGFKKRSTFLGSAEVAADVTQVKAKVLDIPVMVLIVLGFAVMVIMETV